MALPYQKIQSMLLDKAITGTMPITEAQVQPASLDCTLGSKAYRISSGFLPKENETVSELLKKRTLYEFTITPGTILETNTPYIIELNEQLRLPHDIGAMANPKSSIGRVDVFVRVLTDRNPQYDFIPAGYTGPLYLEIIPLTFAIRVAPGLAMTQIRFRHNSEVLPTADELLAFHKQDGILMDVNGKPLPPEELRLRGNVLSFTVDLTGSAIVGYKAQHYVDRLLDLSAIGVHDATAFWTPIERQTSGELILEPNSFYILATKERVRIPAYLAAEIMPYDPSTGELRSHYAGFFDPGFGCGTDGTMKGNIVVLEVRAHSAPFRLTDGQVICKMMFERVLEKPTKLYGAAAGSTYTDTAIRLSKYFS
ncbi:MAG: 2'-deoxycytidine 5'-triphosphate deaminase [Patescibacteria group bacterium]